MKTALGMLFHYALSLPRIDVGECAATMLSEVVKGFEKDTIENDYLIEQGRRVLDGAGK